MILMPAVVALVGGVTIVFDWLRTSLPGRAVKYDAVSSSSLVSSGSSPAFRSPAAAGEGSAATVGCEVEGASTTRGSGVEEVVTASRCINWTFSFGMSSSMPVLSCCACVRSMARRLSPMKPEELPAISFRKKIVLSTSERGVWPSPNSLTFIPSNSGFRVAVQESD